MIQNVGIIMSLHINFVKYGSDILVLPVAKRPHDFHWISFLFLNDFVLSYFDLAKFRLIILYISFMTCILINREIQRTYKSFLNGLSQSKLIINARTSSSIYGVRYAINFINFFSVECFNFMFVHIVITVICNLV